MKFRNIAALLALSATVAACVSGHDDTPTAANPNAGFQVRYTPLGGQMGFPNDLYSGSNGQLAIPGDTAVAENGPLLAMNHLDGFGTQSDISIYFTQPVDETTLAGGILVFKVTSSPTDKHVTGFTKSLVPGTDYSIQLSPGIDSNGQIVTIKPLHPLDPSTVNATTHVPTFSTYMVIVTKGVKDASGDNVSASADYTTILTADTPAILAGVDPTKIALGSADPLFPVAEFDLGQLAVAFQVIHTANPNFALTDIANTFSFSTQFLNISLAELAGGASATTQPTGVGIVDTGKTAFQVLQLGGVTLTGSAAAAAGTAEIYAGDVALPYYSPIPSASDPTAALTGSWKNAKGGDIALSATDPTSFVPKATATQNIIPILVSIPNACGAMPAGGWPVVIFQHGITRNREDMLAIAGTLAAPTTCFAVVAIDLPLHGVTDKTDLLYQNQLFKGTAAAAILTKPVTERTFNMDLENNDSLAAGSDGKIDSSGAWFINLTSTITSRDNLREGAADLLNLVATLPNLHTLGASVGGFDTSKVFFVGHSLGGIVGTDFLGADTASGSPKVVAATLAMPGGHIAELLRNSATFGTIIDNGLAAQGLVKGSQAYYDFYSEAQAVVEDGDPANYAVLATAGHPIHMIEVVGDGTSTNPPDQVVPNSATDVLVNLMGLTAVNTAGLHPLAVNAGTLAQFTVGGHGSFLDPTPPSAAQAAAYLAVTTEMQTEMASLEATLGTAVALTDVSHIK